MGGIGGAGCGGSHGGAGETDPNKIYVSPGEHRERVQRRSYARGGPGGKANPSLPYVELHASSAFSFLDGSSLPEDLMDRAAELGLPAVALLDRSGVYGAPRFYKAAKQAGVRALVGAEIPLDPPRGPAAAAATTTATAGGRDGRSPPDDVPATEAFHDPAEIAALRSADLWTRRHAVTALPRLPLLVASRAGYRNLCRLLTAAAAGRPKGEARASWSLLAGHAEGLWCLTGGDEGPLARAFALGGALGLDAARAILERLRHVFDGRVHVELQRHGGRRGEEHRNRALLDLARSLGLPVVATQGARYARPEDKPLHDVLTALRHRTTLDDAGARLAAERERHLKGARAMERLFSDLPEAVAESAALASRLDFTLADLGYRFPEFPLPPGESPMSYLRHLTWNGARARFRPLTARAQAQIERELAMIEKLDLAGYFLIVWDIVRFCLEKGMLVQGRGSAANSAVCYALSITAVDPVKMELLFERFLSEERGEWPDIDLDLPSGDQREAAIQYVYSRYGAEHASNAAMTANVITYRDRSAVRDVGKALGFAPDQIDRLAKRLGSWGYDAERGDSRIFADEMRAEGFDPDDRRIRHLGDLWRRIQNLPRHLGQHSGGMVIAAGRLDEVVPVEPAAMPGRTVVQWDKDDCADLGIIKVDLLGLGMLNALEQALPMIRRHEQVEVDLAHLPPDDPQVYKLLRAADTVGVFQVESRAQMASLPRNAPTRFYDLVVQVAIIRPGPIQGGMVNPFFERRLGREPVVYPHPSLEPILERTLGVPLFQEQLLRIAMVAAGFTGGEAEELRRAMGFKRSAERMRRIEERLRAGMTERGIRGEAQEQIVQSITSFALYGFPESHAASFALIAYASAWLRCYHPTAFYAGLLNAWPMGFYHPATLIKDAERHGVEVRPIDVNASRWLCSWEENGVREPAPIEPLQGFAAPRLLHGPPPERTAMGRAPLADWRAMGEVAEPASAAAGAPAAARTGASPHRSARRARGALRLGLRYLRGLRQEAGEAIERERALRPFRSLDDLKRRAGLRGDELDTLAESGALASFGTAPPAAGSSDRRSGSGSGTRPVRPLTRRAALWQVAHVARPAGTLFEEQEERQRPAAAPALAARAGSPLPEMSPFEETVADFRTTGVTAGRHPIEYVRPQLERQGIVSALGLGRIPNGERVKTAGSVIVRQRPGTAKGTLFITLEDETGMSQAIVHPDLLRAERKTIVGSPALVVEGIVQQRDGSISLRAEKFWPLGEVVAIPSHDFR